MMHSATIVISRCVLILFAAVFLPVLTRAEDKVKPNASLAREAPHILREAKVFAIGPVGDGGDISRSELALRALLKRPDALDECQKLIAHGSAAGQIYGLLGLRLLHAEEFKATFARYKDSEVPVKRFSGCILNQTQTRFLAAGIASGQIK